MTAAVYVIQAGGDGGSDRMGSTVGQVQISHRKARDLLGVSSLPLFKRYVRALRLGRYIGSSDFNRLQEIHYYCRATKGAKNGGVNGYLNAPPGRRKAVALSYSRKMSQRPSRDLLSRTQAMKRLGISSRTTMSKHCQRMGIPKGAKLTEEEVQKIGRMHEWTTKRLGGPGGPGHQRKTFLLQEEQQTA